MAPRTISTVCPNCKKAVKVPEKLNGQTICCSNCFQQFRCSPASAEPVKAIVEPPPAVSKPPLSTRLKSRNILVAALCVAVIVITFLSGMLISAKRSVPQTGSHPEYVAISGAIITGYDGDRFFWTKKCPHCGYVENGKFSSDQLRWNVQHSEGVEPYYCDRCHERFSVQIIKMRSR